ncbi:hypothetical protein PLEOSDRAFT_1086413 [Pleurotus ostreatus PC15]|uniref:Glucose receptor Git3-like N-terminal domain-containing protein n=2 Tax=Pleurotus TaxID=5320 RepID=A0A067NKJ1_PLEO1|nr:hypothetical protein CCMSSC00406_0010277 [Pleurotus cornucopiae]KDQ24111.1 hypothetical protein PLEOSDRAFT_1086413 [Pleurotus ostreatus PC15]
MSTAGIHGFRWGLASLTFAGSFLSALGSGCILLCYLALPLKRHFRHVLILNLAVADFANSVNNAASGGQIIMHRRDLVPGPGCVLNGMIGQITVQATDCAILAIALVTVYTITRTSSSRLIQGEWEWPLILSATAAIWALPLLTGFLALGKHWYAPVSGNWCWLTADPVYLRYVLTHGWRYLFMVIEVAVYTYLHFYLRRHFRRLAVPIVSNPPSSASQGEQHTRSIPLTPITFSEFKQDVHISQSGGHGDGDDGDYSAKRVTITIDDDAPPAAPTTTLSKASMPMTHIMAHQRTLPPAGPNTPGGADGAGNSRQRAIQRVLLLNAYPLLYILLWIPGLAHRIVEATGHKSQVTQIMQASTQFVGLANALTYGWNERIASQIKEKFRRRA